jgi:DNA-binding response OmpR family regulator
VDGLSHQADEGHAERSAGFSVTTAADGEAALASARARPPDLVVLDLGLVLSRFRL